MKKYGIGSASSPIRGKINEILTGDQAAGDTKEPSSSKGTGTGTKPKDDENTIVGSDTGATPKHSRLIETKLRMENSELRQRLEKMEDMLQELRLKKSKSKGGQDSTNRSKGAGENSHISLSDSESDSEADSKSGDDSKSEDFFFRSGYRRPCGNQLQDEWNHRRSSLARDTGRYIYRVEKWKLKFTGEPNTISVENFLYKLKKIAEREQMSAQQLLRDIHLLLDGPASDWFFVFVDQFENWEIFEKQIRYRFGNPNQDQGIRKKIQERKQHHNESFIAFVTEIEKLNKMLSKPLSGRRKFEVISDNMKQHYRDRTATIEVRNLEHLMSLNHRIDAADMSFQSAERSSSKGYSNHDEKHRRAVNNIQMEDSTDSDNEIDELTSVNAVGQEQSRSNGRQNESNNQRRHFSTQDQRQSQQSLTQQRVQPQQHQQRPGRSNEQSGAGSRACWNCQRPGHSWRECEERPMNIFCYGCGSMGRTIRTCERCSARTGRVQQPEN